MAGEDLYSALGGLQYSPYETPFGTAAGTIASATPGLINPYGSTGQAIGIALGGTLLSSLLGYQARQQAADQSLQAARLGTSLLGAATPQERLSIIESTPDATMQSKLLGLNTQLLGQERLVQALRQQKQAEAEAEAPSKMLLAALQGGLVSPAKVEQLLAAQKVPGISTAKTAEQTLAETVAQPAAKLPEVATETLKSPTPPTVEQLTEADAQLLSPKEYEQKQARIVRQQRDLELYGQQKRLEQETIKDQKRIFREAGKELADTDGAKEYERVGILLGTAENIAKKESPSIGDIQKLIAMAAKTVDKSQVTMGEQDLYTRVDPLVTRWETQIKSNLKGDPQISKKAINDTIDFIRNIHGILGENYNRQAGKIAQSYEVPQVDSIMRLPKYKKGRAPTPAEAAAYLKSIGEAP
jgi:hypothetical protein